MSYKYYIYSSLLHSLVVIAALVNFQLSGDGKSKGRGGEHSEQETSENSGTHGSNKQVLEVSLVDGSHVKKETPKGFFYGIGVSIYRAWVNGVDAYGINEVYDGYPAERMGIKTTDIIIALNGKLINSDNDIASDKSRTLILTIKRGELIFDMTVVTEKIYFKQ